LGPPDVEWARGRLEEPESLRAALEGIDLLIHAAAPYPTRHFGMKGFVARAIHDFEALLGLCRSATHPDLLRLAIPLSAQIAIEQAEMAANVARIQPERAAEIAASVRNPALLSQALERRLDASRHPSFEACRSLPGLKRIVYVSSVTTIGRPRGQGAAGKDGVPANENDRYDIPDPSPYFACKRLLEAVAVRAVNEGLPLVIVNPTLVVDEGDAHRTTARLLLPVARGKVPVALRGWMDVIAGRDVGEGTVRAALAGRTGQRYILGHAWMRLRDFLTIVAEEAGVAPPRLALPIGLVEPVAYATELLAWASGARWPLLPVHGMKMLRHAQRVDASLAVAELGLPQSSIREAVRRALAYHRAEGAIAPRRRPP
jgi:nucleoside-diphosphate-sugar epimerase